MRSHRDTVVLTRYRTMLGWSQAAKKAISFRMAASSYSSPTGITYRYIILKPALPSLPSEFQMCCSVFEQHACPLKRSLPPYACLTERFPRCSPNGASIATWVVMTSVD